MKTQQSVMNHYGSNLTNAFSHHTVIADAAELVNITESTILLLLRLCGIMGGCHFRADCNM